jgi:hypothetical protein
MDDERIFRSRLVVPEHVFRRGFPDETIALNLDSGRYHGLNPVAAHMVDVASGTARVGDAVEPLAAEFGQPEDVIARDLAGLCRDLLERGLAELDDADSG